LALAKTSISFLHRRKYYMVDFVAMSSQQAVMDPSQPNIYAAFYTVHLVESNEVI
jgi:cupin superfamily acireductone dioxygenase involved in methionine salvage